MSKKKDVYRIDKISNAKCNATVCMDKAPPGFNDKIVYNSGHSPPYDRDGRYWLVPPFLIGASVVIVIYIIAHCLYLHCYAKKKMKKLAERHYPPAIVISEDPTSTGSYTPVIQYNSSEFVEARPFLICQPFGEDEWERQFALRRPSSTASSLRSSIKSQTGRLPKIFSKQRSSISNEDESKIPKRASICFVPIGRSMSDPVNANNDWTPLQGFVYMSRTQSCKSSSKDNTPIIIVGTNKSSSGSSGCVASTSQADRADPVVSFQLDDASGDADSALGDIKEEHETKEETL